MSYRPISAGAGIYIFSLVLSLVSAASAAKRPKKHLYATSGHTGNGGWVLYDLEKDPYQMNNLIDDPASAGIRADLDRQLAVCFLREKGHDE